MPSDADLQIPNPKVGPLAGSQSGITTDADGARHIPSSKRPDGSVRNEIRVRPGYRPPEDVEVYRNRPAEAFRSRRDGGVPGAESADEPDNTKPVSTNAARRAAKRRAAAAANQATKEGAEQGGEGQKPDTEAGLPTDDRLHSREREGRKLAKKLRQARELMAKRDEGATLLPEQLEKIAQIDELCSQLDSLGLDRDGQAVGDYAGA